MHVCIKTRTFHIYNLSLMDALHSIHFDYFFALLYFPTFTDLASILWHMANYYVTDNHSLTSLEALVAPVSPAVVLHDDVISRPDHHRPRPEHSTDHTHCHAPYTALHPVRVVSSRIDGGGVDEAFVPAPSTNMTNCSKH